MDSTSPCESLEGFFTSGAVDITTRSRLFDTGSLLCSPQPADGTMGKQVFDVGPSLADDRSTMKATLQLADSDQRLRRKKVICDLLSSRTLKRYTIVLLLATLVGYQVRSQSSGSYNGLDLVDKSGIISKPTDYRDRYQSLGV